MTTILKPRAAASAVGTHLGYSEWLEIDQHRIDLFCRGHGRSPVDTCGPGSAAAGPFGRTIAHGYLTLSLANQFLPEIMRVENVSMG